MQGEHSIFELIAGASVPVQMVMLLLVGASFWSWSIIFIKLKLLRDAKNDAKEFEDDFWLNNDLTDLYTKIVSYRNQSSGMEALFVAGFKEYAKLSKNNSVDPKAILDGAHRSMRVVLSKEIDFLEDKLTGLATIGSISPYIGLFGTVWGIMNSFSALGAVSNATLAMVAPGISEALIATAMGLFAAIPAVVAYNRFSNEVERLINSYDTFMEEFSTILQRQVHIGDPR